MKSYAHNEISLHSAAILCVHILFPLHAKYLGPVQKSCVVPFKAQYN